MYARRGTELEERRYKCISPTAESSSDEPPVRTARLLLVPPSYSIAIRTALIAGLVTLISAGRHSRDGSQLRRARGRQLLTRKGADIGRKLRDFAARRDANGIADPLNGGSSLSLETCANFRIRALSG